MAGRGHVEESRGSEAGPAPAGRDALGASPRWTQASRPGREHVHPLVFSFLSGCSLLWADTGGTTLRLFPSRSQEDVVLWSSLRLTALMSIKLIPAPAVLLRWCVCLFASL